MEFKFTFNVLIASNKNKSEITMELDHISFLRTFGQHGKDGPIYVSNFFVRNETNESNIKFLKYATFYA